MKGTPRVYVAVVMFSVVAVYGLCGAEVPEGAVKVSGKILITKGRITDVKAAELTTKAGEVYKIVPDEKGLDLAKVMHRESAEVVGVVRENDGQKWLKILDYAEDELTAAHELWRRMRCNACVVAPALANSVPPKKLLGATPIRGRYYSMKEKITAWTRDEQNLWLATDNRVLRIDMEGKRLVRNYRRADGLPDQTIYQLAGDGGKLYVVYRGGVAALSADGAKIVDLPRLKSAFAFVHAQDGMAWVLTDTGTFRMQPSGAISAAGSPLPTAARMARLIGEGIWLPQWERRTRHFVGAAVGVGERLYVSSYGDIYEFAEGQWSKIAAQGWGLKAHGKRVWFLTSRGLCEWDPGTGKRVDLTPPEIGNSRHTLLGFTRRAAWVAADPNPHRGISTAGLARFDLASRSWKVWQEINGRRVERVSGLQGSDGGIWAVVAEGLVKTKSAHPGMTYVKRQVFETSGFRLHHFAEATAQWESYSLPLEDFGERLICGQDGGRSRDVIVPDWVEDIYAGSTLIFGAVRLLPRKYYSGYWPSIVQIASRADPKEDCQV